MTIEATSDSERITVIVRPARESDKAGMIEVTRDIWEGNDYLPYVWDEWLAEPEGVLCVAERRDTADGALRMVGLGKLTHLGGENWWMEGMRVQPEFQGRGIASQIHEYLVDFWLTHGEGVVRLTTSSKRLPVHHLCQRLGFSKIGERTFYVAGALQEGVLEGLAFQAVEAAELGEALAFLQDSPMLGFSQGLIDLGWRHALPQLSNLENRLEAGRLFWWGEREGLLSFWEEDDDDENKPALNFLACALEDAARMLVDYRRLAGALDYTKATWMAPVEAEVQVVLEQAGFARDWDDALYVYARRG